MTTVYLGLSVVLVWCYTLHHAVGRRCNDVSSAAKNCPSWKAGGLCQSKKTAMLKYCSKTCDFCELIRYVYGEVGYTHGCDTACQMECLNAHNKYRLNHGAVPVVFDQELADSAQRWADRKILSHSPVEYGGTGGESIAWGGIFPSYSSVVKAFHDEEADYDYNTGESINDKQVGHFTQVVWKPMRKIGCARSTISGKPWYVVHYDKIGVVWDAFPGYGKENVGRPIKPDVDVEF